MPFGSPLQPDSPFGLAAFEASPLARKGRTAWDAFRWEFHAWLTSQFEHGEQGAVVLAARLVEVLPNSDAKFFAAVQAADEARHADAFGRYAREKLPTRYDMAPPLARLLADILEDSRWDVTALGLQIILEGTAMAMLRLGDRTLHDDLIRRIMRLAARDEARHIAFGIFALRGIYDEMSRAERAEREELALECARLLRDWFLLDDVWDRVGVGRREGTEFAAENPMMVAYRRAIAAKVVSAIARVGLLTGRVRDGLEELELLGVGAGRIASG